jgi:hypothetical protein
VLKPALLVFAAAVAYSILALGFPPPAGM